MPALLHPMFKFLTAASLAAVLCAGAAQAQDRDLSARMGKLEQDLTRLQRQVPGGRPNTAEAAAADAAAAQQDTDLTVRILALERTVEQLTGQIEETRFTAERTAKQVQVLQDDLSLRLARIEQSLGASGVPLSALQSAATPPSAPLAAVDPLVMPPPQQRTAAVTPSVAPPPPPGSAFLPGAPMSQPVMQQPSSFPPASTLIAPTPAQTQTATLVPAPSAVPSDNGVANNGGFVIRTDAQGRALPPDPNGPKAPPAAAPAPLPQQAAPRAAPAPGPVTSSQVAIAPAAVNVALPDGTPKEQYEFAFEFLKRQDYPKAEVTLRDFLKKHPKDPLAGNAQYWLGETYYVRGDFQQAAVEFMAGYQNYPKTNKGPDNLLKLGMSMAKLNQTQGACTALGRISKDYSDAPDTVVKSAKAERTRLKCK